MILNKDSALLFKETNQLAIATDGLCLIRRAAYGAEGRVNPREQESNPNTLLSNPLKRIH